MFEGVTTALITPFLKNQEVDWDGLRKNIKFQIEKGVQGILALGTTGETPTLSEEEQEKIIQMSVAETSRRAIHASFRITAVCMVFHAAVPRCARGSLSDAFGLETDTDRDACPFSGTIP